MGSILDFCFRSMVMVIIKYFRVLKIGIDFPGALCEPLSCILHGWELFQKYGPVKQDARILILGAGIIGNLWVGCGHRWYTKYRIILYARPQLYQACVLHHFGFRNVTISELSEKRRKIAERLETGFKVLSVEETAAAMPKDQGSFQYHGPVSISIRMLITCI